MKRKVVIEKTENYDTGNLYSSRREGIKGMYLYKILHCTIDYGDRRLQQEV